MFCFFFYVCLRIIRNMMLYPAFRKQWIRQGCVSSHQILAWHPRFDKNNLVRWVKQGLLTRLKNGLYTFPECLDEAGFAFYAAGCIYKPSYISLHTALSFHGLIPEAVITTTSISTRKTAQFSNAMGTFTYKSIQPGFFFGFELLTTPAGRLFRMAQPEKAIVDWLYLFPFYQDEAAMREWRLNMHLLHEVVNKERLLLYARKTGSKAVQDRLDKLLMAYAL